MNNEQIEKHVEEHSKQLIRHEERIAALKNTDERVTRLNSYFQICGVFVLILGIGSGWLTTRFFAAQREIDSLTTKLKGSAQELEGLLDRAKKEFDSHVSSNPVVAKSDSRLAALEVQMPTKLDSLETQLGVLRAEFTTKVRDALTGVIKTGDRIALGSQKYGEGWGLRVWDDTRVLANGPGDPSSDPNQQLVIRSIDR